MSEQLKEIVRQIRAVLRSRATTLTALGLVGLGGWALYQHPPLQAVEQGEVGVRLNRLTGAYSPVGEGSVLVLPGLQSLRVYSLRDQSFRPAAGEGASPFQTVEGLSIGVDVTVRYALDPARIQQLAQFAPDEVGPQRVAPQVNSVLYKTLARYSVREIFSGKRDEIRQALVAELQPLLAADGVKLEGVMLGKVELPAEYRAGMEHLLAEGLAAEKMRYTLELKDKQVKESELTALAEKVRREKEAEAAAQEQIIAARAQEEAMKHVLPFKQKQIEQRGLEAEADKLARIKAAEAAAQARQIEAAGEAESRRKLADAEVYRQERLGQVSAIQMEREGALIQKHPLLIQKAMADKLSDKVSVIIAPTPRDGGFIGAALLGAAKGGATPGANPTPTLTPNPTPNPETAAAGEE